jgi:hypothetical protein
MHSGLRISNNIVMDLRAISSRMWISNEIPFGRWAFSKR